MAEEESQRANPPHDLQMWITLPPPFPPSPAPPFSAQHTSPSAQVAATTPRPCRQALGGVLDEATLSPSPRNMAATVTTTEFGDGGDDCHSDEEQQEAQVDDDKRCKNFVIMITIMLRILLYRLEIRNGGGGL